MANILTPQAFSNKFDRRTPYSMQWLFNVQRELAQNLTFEAGYLGSISRHLESYRGVSAAVPGPGTVASRSPYPNFGTARAGRRRRPRQLQLAGHEADQALFERPDRAGIVHVVEIDRHDQRHSHLGQRLAVLAGWTLHAAATAVSRRSTTVTGWSSRAFTTCRSARDAGWRSRIALLDAVVGGWQVGGITTWRSGFPINPSAGVNRANTNINVDRPDATGQRVSLDTPTTERWFNTAAFALQPIYQFGNAARNSVPGPPASCSIPTCRRASACIEGPRAAVPVGVVQSAQSSGLGLPECESEQPQLRPDHVDGGQYAADAVCPEVRVLIEPMLTVSVRCALIAVFALGSAAQNSSSWTEPFPAHRIAGNLYYVGSRGLASYLITTPEGHILINSSLEASVPLIEASIAKLGFQLSDVKILLVSHAHWDHNAGSAALKERTGAKYMVMEPDVRGNRRRRQIGLLLRQIAGVAVSADEGGPRLT